MGKTYRRDSGFRPKKGRGFKDFKQSRKFREKELDKFDKFGKRYPIETVPELDSEIEE